MYLVKFARTVLLLARFMLSLQHQFFLFISLFVFFLQCINLVDRRKKTWVIFVALDLRESNLKFRFWPHTRFMLALKRGPYSFVIKDVANSFI